VSEMRGTLVGDSGSNTIRNAVQRCLDEVHHGSAGTASTGPAVIAGIGTTAPHALKGRLLRDALAHEGVELAETVPLGTPEALLTNPAWTLALVLSPWKQAVAQCLDLCTPSAEQTGVVDTIVREARGTIGVNTNCWASQAAMETLMGGTFPSSVLVLGSGGSSNSVAMACRRAWPDVRLIGSARKVDAAAAWARRFDAEVVAPSDINAVLGSQSLSLLINTTTWGETDASEEAPFVFDFGSLASPGNRFFDLNNRVSALQTSALQAGMTVMSGTFMQRATNACRAALSRRRTL